MKSTGEVMGLDRAYEMAFAKSQLGGGTRLPRAAPCSFRSATATRPRILEAVRLLARLGFKVIATSGTQRSWPNTGSRPNGQQGVGRPAPYRRRHQKRPGSARFQHHRGGTALADSRSLRRAALLHKVPYYTTLSGAVAAAQGIKAYLGGDLEVRALQSYFGGKG